MIKESLNIQAQEVHREKEELQNQLTHLRNKITPYQTLEIKSVSKGKQKALRAITSFTGIICAQFLLMQSGTYVFYSWDIIEPITCLLTMSDATVAYWFWNMTGKPWNLHGLEKYYIEKTMRKEILKKKNADWDSH